MSFKKSFTCLLLKFFNVFKALLNLRQNLFEKFATLNHFENSNVNARNPNIASICPNIANNSPSFADLETNVNKS